MRPATATSVALLGITGHLVPVYARPAAGRHTVGLVVLGPDGHGMDEARDRVRAGIIEAGMALPEHGLTVSIPPCGHPRPGPGVDLAIAAVALAATGQLPPSVLDEALLVGELGLDGRVRPVRGVLPMLVAAAGYGIRTVVLPAANADEAGLVPGIRIVPVDSLRRLVRWASGHRTPAGTPPRPHQQPVDGGRPAADLSQVPTGRAGWALEVAAAGGHNLGLTGPPGSAAPLAGCLSTLLPDLDDPAAWEVSMLWSAAGRLPEAGLVRRPPVQTPHSGISAAQLLGGGPQSSRPGVVSLAHHGVLVLDDAAMFSDLALDVLRPVVDHGRVELAGGGHTVSYPARFQLVLATRPCPCPADAHATTGEACTTCAARDRRRHLGRICPLWQRTDIRLRLDLPEDPPQAAPGESPATVAERVTHARQVAAARWAASGHQANSQIPDTVLQDRANRLPAHDIDPLLRLVRIGVVDGGGALRVLRLAWTISDLRGGERPRRDDVDAAIDLREPHH